jgi:alanyl-tRNA synthetase
MSNHTATHLLHASLRKILGTHVEQKGSLVNDEYLRFDFSHYARVASEELEKIESLVNRKVRENIPAVIEVMPLGQAKKMGAMALFGEKYGEMVRVVAFDKNFSVELCGGTHVKSTGEIGLFRIVSESAIAAGVRRVEAITSVKAEEHLNKQLSMMDDLKNILKTNDVIRSVQSLLEENTLLKKQVEHLMREKAKGIKTELRAKVKQVDGISFLAEKIDLGSADAIRDIAFEMRKESDNLFLVLGAEVDGRPSITVAISDRLVKEKNLHAGNIVRELAREIKGGGGGQPFYATAGGSDANGITRALEKAKGFIVH